MIQKLNELSLFFPAFNEEDNIEKAIEHALQVLPEVAEKYEVIIVNDGSKDATLERSAEIASKNNLVRVVSQENKGYGGAIKLGLATCKYDWIFFSDADLQFDLSEIKKFLDHASSRQLVIGFRQNRAEGWKRVFLVSALR